MRTTERRRMWHARNRWCCVFVAAFLQVIAGTQGGSAADDTAEMVLDPGAVYQTMEGWGGNIYPAATELAAKDATLYDKACKELRTTQMRIRSSWYLLEERNDNGDPDVIDWEALRQVDRGIVHDEFLMLQELTKRDVKLLFAAWRFPYWMCGHPTNWNPGSKDRPPLPKEMEAEFIESLTAYFLYAREEYGVTFEAISISNEPNLPIYIGGLDTGRLAALTLALKKRLAQHDYKASFYGPDITGMNAKWAQRYLDGGGAGMSCSVAFHSYNRNTDGLKAYRALGERFKLPVWVTEQQHMPGSPPDRFEWSHAMRNALCLHDILVDCDATLSLYWCYVASSSRLLGMYIPEKKEWSPTWSMLKHFHNEIPPGSVRVAVEPTRTPAGVRSVAFMLPAKNALALILINEGEQEQSVRLAVKGQAPKVLHVRKSDPKARYEDVTPSAGMATEPLTFRLPAQSITSVGLIGR